MPDKPNENEKAIRELEAFTVGPDEVLIIRVDPRDWAGPGDEPEEVGAIIADHLGRVGLADRSLVFAVRRDAIEFVKVKREAIP